MAQFPSTIEPLAPGGSNGVKLGGVSSMIKSGFSAGDVNGDGFADLI
jgi:hypothetical protein